VICHGPNHFRCTTHTYLYALPLKNVLSFMYHKKKNIDVVCCVAKIESLRRCDILKKSYFRNFPFILMKESLGKWNVSHRKKFTRCNMLRERKVLSDAILLRCCMKENLYLMLYVALNENSYHIKWNFYIVWYVTTRQTLQTCKIYWLENIYFHAIHWTNINFPPSRHVTPKIWIHKGT
jgi:hypothetical protein